VSRDCLLVVDDEPLIRFGIREYFEGRGWEVEEAGTLGEARRVLARLQPDSVVLDYRLPDGNSMDFLTELRERDQEITVVVLTGYGSIDLAVKAIKLGAENFLTKPIELQALEVILDRGAENRRLRRKQRATQPRRDSGLDPFIGPSAAMRHLRSEAELALRAEGPVLILGPTGAGKGVLARWLHENGTRSNEAFVDLNCAGLSREFLESELFGHARGAFTSAVQDKRGLFEVANRGTLFLDEVGDLDPSVQPKILKVLEEKRFRRLGEVVERRVDVRLLAATNHDLAERVAAGTFRDDLYYRINNLVLQLPPLADRAEDLPYLADRLLRDLASNRGREVRLDPAALESLRGYAWPGNLRELRNVLEQALLRASGPVLRPEHLRFSPAPRAAKESAGGGRAASTRPTTLAEVEKAQIEKALAADFGRVAVAAGRLGIPRSTLYQKLKEHGIDVTQFQPGKGSSDE
jgi:DNA-binding NtrC family response regulator